MRGPCDCDPEIVFELADGTLSPARKSEVQEHLDACPECQELYQREVDLNAYLERLEISEARSRSVCQGVAMALPTRPVKARLLWGTLALALLLAALVALDLNGTNPVTAATSAVDVFWSIVSGFAHLAVTVFSMAGPVILIALAFGAVADLVIAAAVLSAARRSSRQA
ncbi:MAG TPA: zf-HC2 domain-containing protein [Rubrobacteraceae bacterium]|nr:zf-HC2 domain-containing protein [Rubrobacteraceae bacterium]